MNEHKVKNYELRDDCPIKSAEQNDLFKNYEKNKKKISSSNWECDVCHKQFSNEEYLEKHIEKNHVVENSKGICLADFCSFLPCKEGYEIIVSKRCETIMDRCFDEGFSIFARKLCYINYEED